MNLKKILKNQVVRHLLENPIDDTAQNKYDAVRKQFGLDIKTISRWWIEVKNAHFPDINQLPAVSYRPDQVRKILSQTGDNLTVALQTDTEIRTLESLLLICEVDSTLWDVVSWECKKWDVGGAEKVPSFSVSAKFKPKRVEADLQLQKQIILKELFAVAPTTDVVYSQELNRVYLNLNSDEEATCLLELALFDVHFGKLAHKEEVGEDYDIKIAAKRYRDAINELLGRVNLILVDRILLPIGQDLINIDNLTNSTTAGTPQDTDSRFHKIVKTVKALLIETINYLSSFAPVDVVITVGNHDEQTSFMIGEMLDAYYHNNEAVIVYNDASLRKYYKYGTTSILFTHGNREKFSELGMIFAAENPKLWAATTQRYIQIGHYHHNKKVTTVQAQEFQGFQVQILPSLSGSDAWHRGKGYQSLKQAKAFLYHKKDGLVGEFTYSVV